MDLEGKNAYLEKIGCCRRCCLRYSGKQNPESFQPVDTPNEELYGEKPAKILKPSPCSACVGLLQDSLIDSVVEMATSELNGANYDTKSFSFALSLPVSFQIRAHAMLLHLIEKFPGEGKDVPPEARFLTIKEVFKIVAGAKIAKAVNKKFDSSGNSQLSVGVNFTYEDDENECAPLAKMDPSNFLPRSSRNRNEKVSRKSVDPSQYPKDKFKKFFACPPTSPDKTVTCSSVTASHASVFVAGRYRKLVRGLSQTPWFVRGERQMETSVQELLCDRIVKLARADDMRFSSSGREDVDVRMLGRGRPFACELINPRHVNITAEEFRAIEKELLSEKCGVEADLLQIVSKDTLNELKKGEEEKMKDYVAYCVVKEGTPNWERLKKISDSCPIIVQQRTPIRVMHRRSLATRPRTVEWMEVQKAETDEPRAFVARFRTEAGFYVKEFVHGDLGRSKPNISDLYGCDVDILALDVEDIKLDWPPQLT